MFSWAGVYSDFYTGLLTEIIGGVVVALLTTGVGVFFFRQYGMQLNFSKKMKELGFKNTVVAPLLDREVKEICKNSREIKLIFVSGTHFMKRHQKTLKRAMENGVSIKLLCADPHSTFLTDIENMEHNYVGATGEPLRKKGDHIGPEIYEIIDLYRDTALEIRFYSSEYRLPYILAYDKEGKYVDGWITMTFPPCKSVKAFVLRGRRDYSEVEEDDFNFIEMAEMNFDTIWEFSSKSLQEIEVERETSGVRAESFSREKG